MKQLIIFFFAPIIITGCKEKPQPTDSHNRSLENIPFNELKTILSGKWLLKKDINCGFVGCYTTNFPAGQQDTFSFLQQDSVRQVKPNGTVVVVYDKAIIWKHPQDSVWVYEMYGGLVTWAFLNIKNDTLILRKSGGGSESSLVKTP